MENKNETVAEEAATKNNTEKVVKTLNFGKFTAGAKMFNKDEGNAELLKDVEIEFGIDPDKGNPIIVCQKASSSITFTWKFLIAQAIKEGLLDSLIKEKLSEVKL